MDNKVFAERIKKIRQNHNLTQTELAEIAGVKKTTISSWERGIVSSVKGDTMVNLQEKFNINPFWLVDENQIKMYDTTENEKKLNAEVENLLMEMNESQLQSTIIFMKTLLGVNK